MSTDPKEIEMSEDAPDGDEKAAPAPKVPPKSRRESKAARKQDKKDNEKLFKIP